MSKIIEFMEKIVNSCVSCQVPCFAAHFPLIAPFIIAPMSRCILSLGKTPYFIKASMRVIIPVRVPFVMLTNVDCGRAAALRLQHSCESTSK